jgi:hypothetical protein
LSSKGCRGKIGIKINKNKKECKRVLPTRSSNAELRNGGKLLRVGGLAGTFRLR